MTLENVWNCYFHHIPTKSLNPPPPPPKKKKKKKKIRKISIASLRLIPFKKVAQSAKCPSKFDF